MSQLGSWCRLLLAAWLLVSLAPAAHAALYETLTVDSWTKLQSPNSGDYTYNNGVLHITSSTVSGSSYTLVQLIPLLTPGELFGFEWKFDGAGDPNAKAYYYLGNTKTEISGPSGRIYMNVATDTTITFELKGDLVYGKKAPPWLDITPVPEVGVTVAMVLVILAAAGLEWRRRKKTASA